MTTSISSKIVILLEHLLVTMDILINAFGDFFGKSMIIRLSAYALQDMCLIISLIILFLLFFRTEILKSNLVWHLMSLNWTAFTALIVYISLTITLQILIVSNIKTFDHQKESHNLNDKVSSNVFNATAASTATKTSSSQFNNNSWMKDNLIVTFYFLQRISSAVHYYFYRSATYKLHDCNLVQCHNNRCNG